MRSAPSLSAVKDGLARSTSVPAGDGTPAPQAGRSTAPAFSLRHPAPRTGPRRAIVLIALGSMLLTVAGLFHVWVRVQILRYEADLGIEARASTELTETNARLRTEAAWLRRPEAILAVAKERLGMVPVDPPAIHVLQLPLSPSDTVRAEEMSNDRASNARWGEARPALLDEGGRESPPPTERR